MVLNIYLLPFWRRDGRRRKINLSDYNTTSWLYLASRDLKDFQLSWKSKIEPSVAINTYQERFCDI